MNSKAGIIEEEIGAQLQLLDLTIQELAALHEDLKSRPPLGREVAAAGAFLADFYAGIENILKRIVYHCGESLPEGEMWHVELFDWFCEPGYRGLPVLFDDVLKKQMAPFRRFRHVVHHTYASQLKWERLEEGVRGASAVYDKFKSALKKAFAFLV